MPVRGFFHRFSVTPGLVKRPEGREWPGARDYTGALGREVSESLISHHSYTSRRCAMRVMLISFAASSMM